MQSDCFCRSEKITWALFYIRSDTSFYKIWYSLDSAWFMFNFSYRSDMWQEYWKQAVEAHTKFQKIIRTTNLARSGFSSIFSLNTTTEMVHAFTNKGVLGGATNFHIFEKSYNFIDNIFGNWDYPYSFVWIPLCVLILSKPESGDVYTTIILWGPCRWHCYKWK